MVDVATELRLADPVRVHPVDSRRAGGQHRRSRQFLERVVLQERRAALRAVGGVATLGWGSTPSVRLDMEFRHAAVSAFFRLIIGGKRAGVDVAKSCSTTRSSTKSRRADAFSAAIEEARLQPLGRSRGDAFDRIATWRARHGASLEQGRPPKFRPSSLTNGISTVWPNLTSSSSPRNGRNGCRRARR